MAQTVCCWLHWSTERTIFEVYLLTLAVTSYKCAHIKISIVKTAVWASMTSECWRIWCWFQQRHNTWTMLTLNQPSTDLLPVLEDFHHNCFTAATVQSISTSQSACTLQHVQTAPNCAALHAELKYHHTANIMLFWKPLINVIKIAVKTTFSFSISERQLVVVLAQHQIYWILCLPGMKIQ